MDLVLLTSVARNPHITALLDNPIITYPFKKLSYFYANQKFVTIFARATWFQSTPSLVKVNLTVCSSLPQVSLNVFLTQVVSVYAHLNSYMYAVRKSSMVLHFKCLMKFRVQQLFIRFSVINFVTKYRCLTAINECRQLGVCSTKHRIWTIYQEKFLKWIHHSKFCQHSPCMTFLIFQTVYGVYTLYHLFSEPYIVTLKLGKDVKFVFHVRCLF
jgi:hypothetical protein